MLGLKTLKKKSKLEKKIEEWQEKLISPHLIIIKKTEQGVIGFVDRMDKVNAITLVQAKAVARRTRELLATQGWYLWKSSALDSEVTAIVRDELVKTPEGYPIYTEGELEELCRDDVSQATLKLVYEAKKLACAKVATEVTENEKPY